MAILILLPMPILSMETLMYRIQAIGIPVVLGRGRPE